MSGPPPGGFTSDAVAGSIQAVLRLVVAQLRRRAGRTLALLLAIGVAAASFSVLTGSVRTERLKVTNTVSNNFQAAYDILVRPPGSKTTLERRTGQVAPNFLSGIYGGISRQQYHRIEQITGVEVAAPIAMIGYMMPTVRVAVDLSDQLSPATRQLFRIKPTRTTDRGMSAIPRPASYVYVTRRPLQHAQRFGDPIKEVLPGGKGAAVCRTDAMPQTQGPFSPAVQANPVFEAAPLQCWSTRNGRSGRGWGPLWTGQTPQKHVVRRLIVKVPLLVAAVDPAAEARLLGLDEAVISGRYLSRDDDAWNKIPVLLSSRNYLNDRITVKVQRLSQELARTVPGDSSSRAVLNAASGKTVATRHIGADKLYRKLKTQLRSGDSLGSTVGGYWTVAPTKYRAGPGGKLRPKPAPNPSSVWAAGGPTFRYDKIPMDNADAQFREITPHRVTESALRHDAAPALQPVGVFDPAKLQDFNRLSRVPLGAYEPTRAYGGDAAARQALGGQALAPNANIGGYVAQPPQVITTLDAAEAFHRSSKFKDVGNTDAPISVIRVRVSGVTGPDEISRERIRQVAEQITKKTGLTVDITAGSSPSPQTVELPAGKFGRPQLTLQENWVKKGVAVTILSSLDRKSLVLFALVLLVCALFITNASAAAVRSRRSELGVLACLGWSPRRLYGSILIEHAVVGLVAGGLGGGVAVATGALTGLEVSPLRAALAIPAATLLALLAGLVPARRAARTHPSAALTPPVHPVRRSREPRTVAGLALSNTLRVPGRSAVGALSLAVGTAALTMLLGITYAFHGVLVGSLLGDAVSLRIRPTDTIAIIITVALGALAVADVLYLNIRDRVTELATLRATGWSETKLACLIGYEAAIIGAFGATLGAAAGLAGTAAFAGTLPAALLITTVVAITAGIVVTILSAIIPAIQFRRLPTAAALAEEY